MTELAVIFIVIGLLTTARRLFRLISAELGRKKDLVRQIYKQQPAYRISLLIPFLDGTQGPALSQLLTALGQQDYPKAHVRVHIATTREHAVGLPVADQLPEFVQVWVHPDEQVHIGQTDSGAMLSWLIERLLARGGPASLFAFLDPTDIVRPDFLKNITIRATHSAVFQGYLALKRPMSGWFGKVYSLGLRLVNRIENAGGFHMGLSTRLLSSGWVVRQELLEMIPYKQGVDVDHMEYTMRLAACGYPVQWAPNVVVYKDDRQTFETVMDKAPAVLMNRLRLLLTAGLPYLGKGLITFNFSLIDLALTLMHPPQVLVGVTAMAGLAFSLTADAAWPVSLAPFWAGLLVSFAVVQLLSLGVARCKPIDVAGYGAAVPAIGLLMVASFPYYLAKYIWACWVQRSRYQQQLIKARVGQRLNETMTARQPSRFADAIGIASSHDMQPSPLMLEPSVDPGSIDRDETESDETRHILDAILRRPADKGVPLMSDLSYEPLESSGLVHPSVGRAIEKAAQQTRQIEAQLQLSVPSPVAQDADTVDELDAVDPFEQTEPLPITNGTHTVIGTLRKLGQPAEGGPGMMYTAVFEYKGLSFTTQPQSTMEEAIGELTDRLAEKGFSLASGTAATLFNTSAAPMRRRQVG
ncbi:MAG: glycosyltransferase family 2 protein [Cyanobacteria bacterium HKST-UBA04]|nr:glycosyltransferase family 2 protein [Cyanobacteria bacterium HKST-UBA04]